VAFAGPHAPSGRGRHEVRRDIEIIHHDRQTRFNQIVLRVLAPFPEMGNDRTVISVHKSVISSHKVLDSLDLESGCIFHHQDSLKLLISALRSSGVILFVASSS
jgi:hypothetical protein